MAVIHIVEPPPLGIYPKTANPEESLIAAAKERSAGFG